MKKQVIRVMVQINHQIKKLIFDKSDEKKSFKDYKKNG